MTQENNWSSDYVKESAKYLEAKVGLITELKIIQKILIDHSMNRTAMKIEDLLRKITL